MISDLIIERFCADLFSRILFVLPLIRQHIQNLLGAIRDQPQWLEVVGVELGLDNTYDIARSFHGTLRLLCPTAYGISKEGRIRD